MKMRKTTHMFAYIVIVALTAQSAFAATTLPSAASPESVGFDSVRLKKLDDYMASVVTQGRVAGMTTLLARHGKIVQSKVYGQADLAKNTPMNKDAIFRIYSMTKPIVGVAMMMLFEEGKWQLDDPVTKFIPEFKTMRVMTGPDAQGRMITEPARRPPTMREVMSHTAGFAYGLDDANPVDKMYKDKAALGATSQQQMIERIADLPLKYQPGTNWAYSIAVDVQGAIIEKISGKSLGAFLDERIFNPLKMTDTAFQVTGGREGRLAQVYVGDPASGKLVPSTVSLGGAGVQDYTKPAWRESGGGGLASTTADYARFCQMLLNKGELDGVRLLSPASVELMDTNVITHEALAKAPGLGATRFDENVGFGLDFAVTMNPRARGWLEGKNTMTWGGAAGTWFWIDPTNDLFFVGMIQRLGPGVEDLRPLARTFTYQALINPEK
jgi:CubicO group peptidase (beta-lactamase class C family)